LELSKGYYEVLTRPKSKVDFEVGTEPKLVSRNGEGLLLQEGATSDVVEMIRASGWTTPKIRPPMILK
jgi:hypothetical protein